MLIEKFTVKCLSTGTPEIINLNLWFLGVPIFKHIRVNKKKVKKSGALGVYEFLNEIHVIKLQKY